MTYFLEAYSNIKYPNTVESKDPESTPILHHLYTEYFQQKLSFQQINSL